MTGPGTGLLEGANDGEEKEMGVWCEKRGKRVSKSERGMTK